MSLSAKTTYTNISKVRMAAVQFPELDHQSKNDFIEMVGHYIDDAAKKQVNIILFPELLTLNLLDNSNHPTIKQLREIVGFFNQYRDYLKSKAVSSGMIIIGGTTITEKENKFYNTAIVAFPSGEIKTVDKTLLTPWELSNHITGVGKSQPLSFNTPWGTAVVLICYEAESAEILSNISSLNPSLVFIPSNTSGLDGLERVHIAAKYIAMAQFAYTLLTGVTSGRPTGKITGDVVGQAVFSTPIQTGYPLTAKYGLFNQPELLLIDANISKITHDKLLPQTTFPSRDYIHQR